MNALKTRDKASDARMEELAAIERELSHLSVDELWEELRSGLTSVTKHMSRIAMCVKLLRDQGVSLVGVSDVQTWIRIAEGRVLPELITTFASSPNRRILERLPIADQARIVKDPMVEVAQKTENGYTKQRVDVARAPAKVVEQVVGYEGLRAMEEQVSIVALQTVKPIAPRPTQDGLDEPSEHPEHKITIRITATELKHLRLHAAEAGSEVPKFVRRTLARSGVLSAPKRKRERV